MSRSPECSTPCASGGCQVHVVGARSSGAEGCWEEAGWGLEAWQSESLYSQPLFPPYRRNGNLGLSGMAIADITLLSGFQALRADLEKVQPPTASSLGALFPLCSDYKCRTQSDNDQGP